MHQPDSSTWGPEKEPGGARPDAPARRGLAGLVRAAARRAGNVSVMFVQRQLLRRRFFEKRIYDYRLVLDSDDPGISAQLMRRGEREPEQRFILERELKPGMTVFDLGANIGYYTVMMARRVGATGRVFAVEPVPANFSLLSRNVELNGVAGWCGLEAVAIGHTGGVRPLFTTPQSNWHSFHEPVVDGNVAWLRKYQRQVTGTLSVPTYALGAYIADKPPFDLLRMDIEGSEVEILRGIAELADAETGPRRILFETHPEFYHPLRNDMRGVLRKLCEERGYRVKYLVSDFHIRSPYDDSAESGRRVFERFGYGREHVEREFRNRAIYTGLTAPHAIELICKSEYVNAALLEREARPPKDAANSPV